MKCDAEHRLRLFSSSTDSDLSIASSFSGSDEVEPHEKSEIVRTDSLTTCPRLLSPADLQLHEAALVLLTNDSIQHANVAEGLELEAALVCFKLD
ncbi:hypothetical protein Q7C36_001432 [Tachysurus vachellii]|uniref:Uncharacterized protein n=1 Tax=Tachysurus vachellii TaxID=175792 RepID=A0AA88NZ99_TACVA|nr:hypothetical protein Q7C36_001432 [Tachysurus vachellii]